MLKIAVILGSTRPGRNAKAVADWVLAEASKRSDAEFKLVDIADFNALKNALDYLNVEWNNKAAGFVGFGSAGGVRAVEHLRQIASELRMAHVRDQVQLGLFTDFENFSEFKPQAMQLDSLTAMFNELVAWTGAMKTLRD